MILRVAAVITIASLAIPGAAAAQVADGTPVVEGGVDFSAGPHGDGGWSSLGVRAKLNVNSRTAIEGTYSPDNDRDGFSQVDYSTVQVRRSLHTFGGGSLYGGLGVAFGAHTFREPPFPGLTPGFSFRSHSAGPSFSFGGELEVAPYLALRGETQYVLSDDSVLRFTGGASVPLGGRYPGRGVTIDAPSLARTPIARLRSGQSVWITTADGREYHGEVASRAPDSLTLRHPGGATAIATSDIDRIEAPDTLTNGILVGMGSGGTAGAVLGGIIGDLVCEESSGCAVIGALFVGGMGAGIGGLVGAIADSVRDNRRPIYDRRGPRTGARLFFSPVVSRDVAGVTGTVRW
jgi:hypothetical protein